MESGPLELARRYAQIERPQAALDALARVEGDGLEQPEYWAIRSEALLQLERLSEASEAAEQGLARDPDDLELLDLHAIANIDLNRPDVAKRSLDRALELAPYSAILLAHHALVAARRKDFEQARASIDKALELDPEEQQVLRVRAQVAVLAGDDPREPIAELLEQYPEDRIGHALLGNVELKRGKFFDASRAFDEAARLDPTDREVARAAREARVATHPVLAPVRPVLRFGRWRSYFLVLTLGAILAAAGLSEVRVVVAIIWLSVVILSWVAPPILRRRERRKYGGF